MELISWSGKTHKLVKIILKCLANVCQSPIEVSDVRIPFSNSEPLTSFLWLAACMLFMVTFILGIKAVAGQLTQLLVRCTDYLKVVQPEEQTTLMLLTIPPFLRNFARFTGVKM